MSGGRCNCGSPHCSSRHPYSGDDRYAQTVYIYTITIYTDCIVQTVYAQIVYMHSHRRLYVYTHSPYGQTVYVHNHRTVQTVYGQIAYIMMHSHRMHSLCMHCICAQSPFCICRPYSQTVRMQDRMEDLAIPTLPGPGLSRWKSWCAGGLSTGFSANLFEPKIACLRNPSLKQAVRLRFLACAALGQAYKYVWPRKNH